MTGPQQVSVYSERSRLAPGHSGNILTCPACRSLWLVLLLLASFIALAVIHAR